MKLETIKKKLVERQKQVEKQGYSSVLPKGLRFLSTLGVFKSGKNCVIDMIHHTGTSYGWWEMIKPINGYIVLNSYGYSSSTINHINKARELFRTLGIKYIEIPAPSGLQDLELAKIHVAGLVAKATVKDKYSRSPKSWNRLAALKLASNLNKIGITISDALSKQSLKRAEAIRAEKLAKLRDRVKLVKNAQESDKGKVGLHVVHEGYMSSSTEQNFISEAKAKGFRTVYIHKSKLELVA